MTVKPRNTLVAPQRGHRALQIWSEPSQSILRQRGRWDRIDHGATTVADKIGHTTVCHNHEAAITIGPRSYFARDDQVAAFVLVHIG